LKYLYKGRQIYKYVYKWRKLILKYIYKERQFILNIDKYFSLNVSKRDFADGLWV